MTIAQYLIPSLYHVEQCKFYHLSFSYFFPINIKYKMRSGPFVDIHRPSTHHAHFEQWSRPRYPPPFFHITHDGLSHPFPLLFLRQWSLPRKPPSFLLSCPVHVWQWSALPLPYSLPKENRGWGGGGGATVHPAFCTTYTTEQTLSALHPPPPLFFTNWYDEYNNTIIK